MSTNGRIPLADLVEAQPGKYLQHNAAAAFAALDAHSQQRYGVALTISPGGAYRTLEEQQQLRDEWEAGGRQGFPPALPGLSNHGLGVAVDIWNWSHLAASDYSRFEFIRDVPGEGWHHHYVGAITPKRRRHPMSSVLVRPSDTGKVKLWNLATDTITPVNSPGEYARLQEFLPVSGFNTEADFAAFRKKYGPAMRTPGGGGVGTVGPLFIELSGIAKGAGA